MPPKWLRTENIFFGPGPLGAKSIKILPKSHHLDLPGISLRPPKTSRRYHNCQEVHAWITQGVHLSRCVSCRNKRYEDGHSLCPFSSKSEHATIPCALSTPNQQKVVRLPSARAFRLDATFDCQKNERILSATKKNKSTKPGGMRGAID